MPCWLFTTAKIHDRAALALGYAPAAAKAAEIYGGKYLVRGPIVEQLEGEDRTGQSAVVLEFPDRAAALAFYNSPEYSAAKKMREGLADITISLVEAMPAPKAS